ncbi:hypothetical protein [Rhodovulum viride]|nr:hypothetical protein [Rhodovulum viride]
MAHPYGVEIIKPEYDPKIIEADCAFQGRKRFSGGEMISWREQKVVSYQ